MDTTFTTKNSSSPHRLLLSRDNDIIINNYNNNNINNCHSNNVTDTTATNYTGIITDQLNITKNKRKNFNPRCSSASADEDDDNNYCSIINKNHHIIIDNKNDVSDSINSSIDKNLIEKKSQQQIAFEAMSINWRKTLFGNQQQQQQTIIINDSVNDMINNTEINPIPITTTTTETTTETTSTTFNDIENNKFYNIPNTNFSIAKSSAAASATKEEIPISKQSIKMINSSDSNSVNSDNNNIIVSEQQINVETAAAVAAAAVSSSATVSSNDPQARLEFACNAFNAVQELLNVYALSLSPSDIVDAFKRQMIGKF